MKLEIDDEYIEKYGKASWMETLTGVQFYPANPTLESINIFDIAHPLALKCRYGGHCKKFYSVGEHSWLIAQWLRGNDWPAVIQLQGLLHDAAEAYLPDVPRPIKHFYQEHLVMEHNLMERILERFGIPGTLHPIIKELDSRIIVNERKLVMNPSKNEWQVDVLEPLAGVYCQGAPHNMVMFQWLKLYQQLMLEVHGEPKFMWFEPGVFRADQLRAESNGNLVYDETKGSVPDICALDLVGGVAWVNVAGPDEPAVRLEYQHGDYSNWINPAVLAERKRPAAVAPSGD